MKKNGQNIHDLDYLSPVLESFSNLYISLREEEGRIVNDQELALLPNVDTNHVLRDEWIKRKKSAERFKRYLEQFHCKMDILDLGCGNGWFSNLMAAVSNDFKVLGMDINETELEQAVRVFKKENLSFAYGDIFALEKEFSNRFDIITLNACIQYFEDVPRLVGILKTYLKPTGEIHLLDSPFYRKTEIENAKKRSVEYYSTMGYPEMADYYFHHSYDQVRDFKSMYNPTPSILHKIFKVKDSPFPWLYFKKGQFHG